MNVTSLCDDGLIMTDRVRGRLTDVGELRKLVRSGELIALRRGAFVPAAIWRERDARARHVLRARAVIAASQEPVVLGGVSAAAVWGMPIADDWSDEVSLVERWRGGGRSDPGVRRVSAGFVTARTELVSGIRCTALSRTALDVARRAEFSRGIGSLDWALWRRNPAAVSKAELFEELALLRPRVGEKHLRRMVGFATSLSDSFGESQSRAVIHELGFAAPELQVEFRDGARSMSVDFFWREVGVIGEFDGKQKYTRNEYTGGNPGEVAWKEKKREDRLRALGCGVVRILTEHVMNPPALARMLVAAGIPRGGGIRSRRDL